MKPTLLALMLLATSPFDLSQQIPCAKFDEHQGDKSPAYTMKGCRSFNELLAAGGIKIDEGKGTKSYACFATTFPEEGEDFFIFAYLSGIEHNVDDKEPERRCFDANVSGRRKAERWLCAYDVDPVPEGKSFPLVRRDLDRSRRCSDDEVERRNQIPCFRARVKLEVVANAPAIRFCGKRHGDAPVGDEQY
jgi:hypothetical protein